MLFSDWENELSLRQYLLYNMFYLWEIPFCVSLELYYFYPETKMIYWYLINVHFIRYENSHIRYSSCELTWALEEHHHFVITKEVHLFFKKRFARLITSSLGRVIKQKKYFMSKLLKVRGVPHGAILYFLYFHPIRQALLISPIFAF